MSKNEADLLKSVRYNLALLCPETDGLLPKHRITYKPEGTTVEEQRADIVIYAYDKFSSLLDGKKRISQLDAHRIMPIALKRYHRSVVSGTIIALRAVPPVSL